MLRWMLCCAVAAVAALGSSAPVRAADDKAAAFVKELAKLKNLTAINLSDTKVTDAGFKELAPLKNLTRLGVNPATVTDAGLKTLREIGLIHALARAGTGGKGRPTKPEEVTILNL